jgi:hypothetical protein
LIIKDVGTYTGVFQKGQVTPGGKFEFEEKRQA